KTRDNLILTKSVRPRSFISSLLNGVGVYLYRHFGSKHLINFLSSLGFSCTYTDASVLELSTILQPRKPTTQKNAFLQFIFDNADFNVNTLDGLGTFHAMGGIMAVTPYEAIPPDSNVPRVCRCSTIELIQKAWDNMDLATYKKRSDNAGLASVSVADVNIEPLNNVILPSGSDIVWLFGKNLVLRSLDGMGSSKPLPRIRSMSSRRSKRKGKVVTLASINSSVKIGNISIVMDPFMLFHRLCIAKQSDDDLKAFFKFELSPFPISLFTGEGMRKGTKSSLYTSFSSITEDAKAEGSQYVVVDGFHLLHKIVWL
ncbi:hypothetical protein AVEN_228118-1, partial [Araneus ventricosus]